MEEKYKTRYIKEEKTSIKTKYIYVNKRQISV